MREGIWKIVVVCLCVAIGWPTEIVAAGMEEVGRGVDPDSIEAKIAEPIDVQIRFEPYGLLWSAAAYESSRTTSGDYAFYVVSPDAEGEAAFHVDAKSSRLGMRMLGPEICVLGCGKVGGLVEIDFQGSFVTENKPGPLLRHAYWQIDGESFKILGGQTWDVISPLNPGMLMYTVGWGAGNIGYRRAQLRGEKIFMIDKRTSVLLQVSANADIVSDFSNDATIAGDHSSWPVMEGRIGFSSPNATIGLSGHIGEQVFDFPPSNPGFDCTCTTWSANVDAVVRLAQRFTLRGEVFTGSNLGAYLGGVLQGMNVARRDHIASTGGWAELAAQISASLDARIGFGIDDPNDNDLTEPSERTRNRMVFGNLSYSVMKNYVFGIEVSHWNTDFVGLSPGRAIHVAGVTKFSF